MNESILSNIKKLLGLSESYTIFDQDIIMHINTVLANLEQMGVVKKGSYIQDNSKTWDSVFEGEELQQIKTYVYLKVRLLFDPPTNSILMSAIEKSANEIEWRMYTLKGGY